MPVTAYKTIIEPFTLNSKNLYIFFSALNDLLPESHVEYLCIRFKNPMAYRKTTELYCKLWHLETSDTICKIENSDWAKELKAATPKELKDTCPMNHYAIYLDGAGFIEVIADEVSILPTIPAELDKTDKLSFSLLGQSRNILNKINLKKTN